MNIQRHRKRVLSKTSGKITTVRQDELMLCVRFKSGDISAFNELSKNYLKLINAVAVKYHHRGIEKSELVLFAKIGLLKAAHRYDESKMVSFRLYAIWWMRQVVLKALDEQSRIEQIPEMMIANLREIIRGFEHKSLRVNPTAEMIEVTSAVKTEINGLLQFRKNRN